MTTNPIYPTEAEVICNKEKDGVDKPGQVSSSAFSSQSQPGG